MKQLQIFLLCMLGVAGARAQDTAGKHHTTIGTAGAYAGYGFASFPLLAPFTASSANDKQLAIGGVCGQTVMDRLVMSIEASLMTSSLRAARNMQHNTMEFLGEISAGYVVRESIKRRLFPSLGIAGGVLENSGRYRRQAGADSRALSAADTTVSRAVAGIDIAANVLFFPFMQRDDPMSSSGLSIQVKAGCMLGITAADLSSGSERVAFRSQGASMVYVKLIVGGFGSSSR